MKAILAGLSLGILWSGGVVIGGPAALNCDPPGHLDIGLKVEGGRLETGIYDLNDPNNPALLSPGVRVWGGRFQAGPLDPFFTDDPGFGAVAGSGLPQGSQVGFNILDDLRYWNGQGPVQWGPVPGGEQLRIRFGFQNRWVGTGTGVQTGFNFDTVGSGGTVHRHLSFFLLGSDGNAVPAAIDGVQAADGIYLLKIQVTTTAPGILPSEPVYIVFVNFSTGPDDCRHCTALNHAGARLGHDRPAADQDFDRDVDADDFVAFEACFSGAAVSWTDPCCQGADLDADGDIDMNDFGLLQRCYAGPGVIADPACAGGT